MRGTKIATVLAAAAVLAGIAAPAHSGTPTCYGETPDNAWSADGETINGTPGNDVLFGGDGPDDILGRGGTDFICGGDGRDDLSGGLERDRVAGQDNIDDISGDEGSDRPEAGAGTSPAPGEEPDHANIVYGGPGNDQLLGGPDVDALLGEGGDDFLDGRGGPYDACRGGPGADTVTANCEL